MTQVTIYTDGSASTENAAIAAIIQYGEIATLKFAQPLFTPDETPTNNIAEITAATTALKRLTRPCTVEIISDSKYLVQGFTEWLPGWQANGWQTSKGKPVKNRTHWEALLAAAAQHDVTFTWTEGHSDNPLNNEADKLANHARKTGEAVEDRQVHTRVRVQNALPRPGRYQRQRTASYVKTLVAR